MVALGCSRQTAVAFRACTESDALYCAHSRFTHAIGAHCAVPCHVRTVSSVNTKQEKATELTNLVGWVVRMECLSETDRDEMLERVSCSGTAHRCGLHIASTSVAQSLLALARRRRAATAFRTDWAEYSTCRTAVLTGQSIVLAGCVLWGLGVHVYTTGAFCTCVACHRLDDQTSPHVVGPLCAAVAAALHRSMLRFDLLCSALLCAALRCSAPDDRGRRWKSCRAKRRRCRRKTRRRCTRASGEYTHHSISFPQ